MVTGTEKRRTTVFAGADTQRAAQRVTRRNIDASFNVKNEIDADGDGGGSSDKSEDKEDREEKDDEFVFDSVLDERCQRRSSSRLHVTADIRVAECSGWHMLSLQRPSSDFVGIDTTFNAAEVPGTQAT